MKRLYRICDLSIGIDTENPEMLRSLEDYACAETVNDDKNTEGKEDFSFVLERSEIERLKSENQHLSYYECEYILAGSLLAYGVIPYGGFMLHSSAIAYGGMAYLFSAPSGTGKSTHTQYWQERFGSNAVIFNDDKPIIRIKDGVYHAYGTPFCGSSHINRNTSFPIGGICFLMRGNTNRIWKISNRDSIFEMLNQTARPRNNPSNVMKLINTVSNVAASVPIYKMSCTKDETSVDTAIKMIAGSGFVE